MRLKVGYDRSVYSRTGVLVDVTVRLKASTLISGTTGTGKTFLLWYMLHFLIQWNNQPTALFIQFCDWKQEHSILYGCRSYHGSLDDIINTIDSFYDSFQNARSQHSDQLHFLIIDEYMSFINYLENLSKIDKRYKEIYSRIVMEISSILAMGRTINFFLVCLVQQARAASFSSTADRENFINRIAMGALSSTSAAMIFDTADCLDIDFRAPIPIGCGYVAVQGDSVPVRQLIVPKIGNPDTLHNEIRNFLDNQDSQP